LSPWASKKNSGTEHEVGGRYDRVGVRVKRIEIKMVRSTNSEVGRIKRILLGGASEEREYRETILLFFARAGFLNSISFFFRLIGFKG
jgi:hypothetical protein